MEREKHHQVAPRRNPKKHDSTKQGSTRRNEKLPVQVRVTRGTSGSPPTRSAATSTVAHAAATNTTTICAAAAAAAAATAATAPQSGRQIHAIKHFKVTRVQDWLHGNGKWRAKQAKKKYGKQMKSKEAGRTHESKSSYLDIQSCCSHSPGAPSAAAAGPLLLGAVAPAATTSADIASVGSATG